MLRVTQRSLYSSFVNNMNTTLSQLQELNLQSSTQKRVNRPSDDPVGMSKILSYRQSLTTMTQYQDNITTAKGWLNLADSTLGQVSTLITSAKALAQQGATGTISDSNRQELSYQARQYFEQLLNLANTTYQGQSIFAGQKTDGTAFKETLWMQSNDPSLSSSTFSIQGSSDSTLLVRFNSNAALNSGQVSYEYSDDGGKTFHAAQTIPAGGSTVSLDLGGVRLDLSGSTVVSKYDASNPTKTSTGSWIWVRPTAQYTGDDEDQSGTLVQNIQASGVTGSASGVFGRDVVVRIDSNATFDGTIHYSYSLDNGSTWTAGNVASNGAIASNSVLVVPGGLLTLSNSGAGSLHAGDEFIIHPRSASINLEISAGVSMKINNVGKDIFGGVYQDPSSSSASVVFGSQSNAGNLFETMGKLVAALETNDQAGCQAALEQLTKSSQTVLTADADVGGRENRLDITSNVLTQLSSDETSSKSKIEDVDLVALLTNLTNQQTAYQAILKSSSTIMQMSLLSYL